MLRCYWAGPLRLALTGAKAATRIGANLSPEPFSNFALSLLEDMVVIGSRRF